MKIGVIGTGTIASALVEGIAGDGHDITVSSRGRVRSEALARAFACVSVAGNQQVIDRSEVVFLGLMAETAGEVLAALRFRAEHRVVSLMAGASLEVVQQMVAPARAEAIMIPFPGIARGGSPIIVQGEMALVETLFGARNSLFSVTSGAELGAYLSAQAVLSPVVRMVGDAAGWLGPKVSDPAQGEAFLRLLIGSSLSDAACEDLIEALNTPGGYNQRLRLHMEDAGMRAALTEGLDDLARG